MVVPTSNVDKTEKAGTNNGPAVAEPESSGFVPPFADGLYEKNLPIRPITDYFYAAVSSFFVLVFFVLYCLAVYATFVEPLVDTPVTIQVRSDKFVAATRQWMLQLVAITALTLIIFRALPYMTAKILKKSPLASAMLDVAVIVAGLLYFLDHESRFKQPTWLSLSAGYGGAVVGLSLLPVIAFFKLAPAGKRALAIARMTYEAMDNIQLDWLGVVASSDYVAFGARYWQRPQSGFVTAAIINQHSKAVAKFNKGAMMTFKIIVAIGDSLFQTEAGKRWRRFRSLMHDEPYIISCVQAYDLKTSAEMYEAYQERRKGFIRSMKFESLIIRAMSWALFLRMSILSLFLLIGTCELLDFNDFFRDSESIFIVASSFLWTYFYFYSFLLLRGARTIIECGKQEVELMHQELQQHKITHMNEILVKAGPVSKC